jgi:hypothetical protein
VPLLVEWVEENLDLFSSDDGRSHSAGSGS